MCGLFFTLETCFPPLPSAFAKATARQEAMVRQVAGMTRGRDTSLRSSMTVREAGIGQPQGDCPYVLNPQTGFEGCYEVIGQRL